MTAEATNGHTVHVKKQRRTGLFIAPVWARRVIRHTKFKSQVVAYERDEEGKLVRDFLGKLVPKKTAEGKRVYENAKQPLARGRMRKYAPLALASFAEAALRTAANEAYACVAEADTHTLKPMHFFKATIDNPTMAQLFPGHYLLETKRAKKSDDEPKKAKIVTDVPVVSKKIAAKKAVTFVDDVELSGGKMELVED